MLTHLTPMLHFYTSWKRQNIFSLSFSEGIEMDHWAQMGTQSWRNNQNIFMRKFIFNKTYYKVHEFNPLLPNGKFIYTLQTSENHKVFWCFQEVLKCTIGKK